MARVRIRPVRNHAEFRQCEQLQIRVWGSLSVSSEVMIVTQKYGGTVLGAFVEGSLAGFLYAFLARRQNRMIHWSHMMAVAPDYRDRRIGFRMKMAHRELALKQGIKSICWTFDPLQGRNATLNIARLGARPEEYVADCYGHFSSKIESGLPSDRFVVSWLIDSPRVRERHASAPFNFRSSEAWIVNETATNAKGLLENHRLHLNLRHRKLLVEIPVNTDQMRSANLKLAERWRMEARRIFQKYMTAGYAVETFLPPGVFAENRCAYVLTRSR